MPVMRRAQRDLVLWPLWKCAWEGPFPGLPRCTHSRQQAPRPGDQGRRGSVSEQMTLLYGELVRYASLVQDLSPHGGEFRAWNIAQEIQINDSVTGFETAAGAVCDRRLAQSELTDDAERPTTGEGW